MRIVPNQWNVCGNVRDEYTNCGREAIVQCGNTVCIMIYWNMKVRPVWWWQKVQFLEMMVVIKLTPLELTQYLRTPSELVRCGVQQLLIVELVTMVM